MRGGWDGRDTRTPDREAELAAQPGGSATGFPSLFSNSICAGSETTLGGASLGRNHAELSHLREDVDDPRGLSDPPVDEPDDEDLVVRDGFAGWWDAHVLAPVGSGNHVPADEVVPLCDQILDRDVQVGVAPKEGSPTLA